MDSLTFMRDPEIECSTGVTFEEVRALALALPGVEEGTSYRTPAFRVGGRLLARLREDGETLVVLRIDVYERDLLMQSDPEVYYVTDHYRPYPTVLVRLAAVERDELRALIEQSWRRAAPRRLLAAHPITP